MFKNSFFSPVISGLGKNIQINLYSSKLSFFFSIHLFYCKDMNRNKINRILIMDSLKCRNWLLLNELLKSSLYMYIQLLKNLLHQSIKTKLIELFFFNYLNVVNLQSFIMTWLEFHLLIRGNKWFKLITA